MSYQITGNKIPISKEELINYTHKQLSLYDAGKMQDANPYSQPIVYITKEGKMIQVPQEIQKEAISSWTPKPKVQKAPVRVSVEAEEKEDPDYITIGILLLAAAIALYLFTRSNKGSVMIDPNTRYYITQ